MTLQVSFCKYLYYTRLSVSFVDRFKSHKLVCLVALFSSFLKDHDLVVDFDSKSTKLGFGDFGISRF